MPGLRLGLQNGMRKMPARPRWRVNIHSCLRSSVCLLKWYMYPDVRAQKTRAKLGESVRKVVILEMSSGCFPAPEEELSNLNHTQSRRIRCNERSGHQGWRGSGLGSDQWGGRSQKKGIQASLVMRRKQNKARFALNGAQQVLCTNPETPRPLDPPATQTQFSRLCSRG